MNYMGATEMVSASKVLSSRGNPSASSSSSFSSSSALFSSSSSSLLSSSSSSSSALSSSSSLSSSCSSSSSSSCLEACRTTSSSVDISTKVSSSDGSEAKKSSSLRRSNALPNGVGRVSSGGASVAVSESNESYCSSQCSNVSSKPHKANDPRWEAIQSVLNTTNPSSVITLGPSHFRLVKRLGSGDIGSVFLAELKGSNGCFFAMKVMDKGSLASRKKLLRTQTERDILQLLDHPFLPTLYAHFETDKFSCLVMEFCSGGDLHTSRQRQVGKHFTEPTARFYGAEVLLALEYLHMMGVVYRDLKPENVLVRDDGHIMLSDFDLSLRCTVNPTLVKVATSASRRASSSYCVQPVCLPPSCIAPPCLLHPSCFLPRLLSLRLRKGVGVGRKGKNERRGLIAAAEPFFPELIAEPTGARSLSFVGTHEYLAPEIIKGEGHGSAVDWWTLGIFLYELLLGKTPFKGAGNRATLHNVVGQPLRFPESPPVSFAARDLIRGLLVKDPQQRLAFKRGAAEIKQHPFFEGINWALVRSLQPPEIPPPADFSGDLSGTKCSQSKGQSEAISNLESSCLDFDIF